MLRKGVMRRPCSGEVERLWQPSAPEAGLNPALPKRYSRTLGPTPPWPGSEERARSL
jgi:hypothetical protein